MNHVGTFKTSDINTDDCSINITSNIDGNLTSTQTIATSNIYSGTTNGNITIYSDINFEGNITSPEQVTFEGNLNVNGLLLSDDIYISISYMCSVTNFSGTRTGMVFEEAGYSPYVSLAYESEVYGIQISAGDESNGYMGNIDFEVYSSQSTTPFYQVSLLANDSRWTTTSAWLDGSMTSIFGRNFDYIFPSPTILPADTLLQVIIEGTNSFSGTGLDPIVRILTRTCV